MPINGKVKQLYDALKYDGADVGTEQEFNDYFFAKGEQGYKNRKAVYDAFKSDGADVGENYEEFASWLELQPKTHKVPRPQNTPKQNESWWDGDPSFRQDQQQYTQKVYNPAEDNMGVGVGAAILQPKPVARPKPATQPAQTQQQVAQAPQQVQNTPKQQKEEPYQPTIQEQMAFGWNMGGVQSTIDNVTSGIDKMQQGAQKASPFGGNVGLGNNKNLRRGNKTFDAEKGAFVDTYLTSDGREFRDVQLANNAQAGLDEITTNVRLKESLKSIGIDPDIDLTDPKNVNHLLGDAYAERDRLNKGMENIHGQWVDADGRVHYGNRENDEAMQDLQAAYRQNERRINALETARDNGGFWGGTADVLTDPSTYSFGLTDLEDAKQMAKIKSKIDSARENGTKPQLSESEKALVRNFMLNQQAEQLNKDNWWYNAGKGFGQTLSFMKDFALTGGGFAGLAKGGLSIGGNVGKKAATKILGDYMTKNLGTKVLGKTMEYIGKGVGLAAGAEAGGFMLNNTAQAASNMADVISKQTGNLTVGKDGMLDFENSKNLGMAVLQSQIARTGENGSELVGLAFDKMPQILGRVIQKTTVGKTLKKLTENAFWKKGEGMLNYLGISSVWGEGMEEEYNMARTEILNRLTNGEFAPEGSGLFDKEKQLDTWKTVGLTSMVLRVPSMVATGTATANYYANKYNLNTSDKNLRYTFGDYERYEAVKSMIDGADNQKIAGVLNNLMTNAELSDEEKQAMFLYANDLIKVRGFNIGNVVAAANGYKEPPKVSAYQVKADGKSFDELDKDGNVIAHHEYETNDEMKVGLYEAQQKRFDENFNSDISILKSRPEDQFVKLTMDYWNNLDMPITYDEFMEILEKPSMERTDEEQQMIAPFADVLHNTVYDNTILHEEQSQQDGEDVAEADSIDIEEGGEQGAIIAQQWQEAQASRNAVFEQNEDLRQEVELMESQGLSHQEIISRLDWARPEQVQAVIDYYNAKAKFEGYVNRKAQKIDEEAANSRQRHTMKGTIDGKADLNNVYTITDGTNHYYLVSGDITTDPATGRITGAASGLIIGMDLDGSFVNISDTSGYSLEPSTMTLDQFEEAERERLGQQITSVIDPNQTIGQQTNQPQPIQAGEQSGEEAGAITGTGANEAPAATPAPSVEQQVEVAQPQQPSVTIDSVADKDGIKRYENGIAVDDAIADIQNDGLDVNEVADASIAEAQQTIDKIDNKPTKTRKDLVDKKNAQNIITYYNNVKARWAEMNAEAQPQPTEQQAEEPVVEEPATPSTAGMTVEELKQQRIAEAKAKYGELFDNDFTKANDVFELVSMWVGRKRNLAWDDVNGKRGLQKELGWTRKIGGDTKYIETLLAKNGEGMGVDEFVHMVWESPENDVNGEKRFNTEEIKEALLELLRGATSKSDVVDYALNSRIVQAEAALQQQQQMQQETAIQPQQAEQPDVEIPDGGLPFAPATDEDFTNDVNEDTNQPQNDVTLQAENRRQIVASEQEIADTLAAILPNMQEEEVAQLEGLSNDEIYEALIKDLEAYLNNEGISVDEMEFPDNVKEIIKREINGTEENEVRLEQNEKEATGERTQAEEQRTEVDEYLKPRNAEEEDIISGVVGQLQQEIQDTINEQEDAREQLEKAIARESERSSDMFGNDNALNQDGQLFDNSEMPVDKSVEGIERRTTAERERLQDVTNRLNQLQSEQERNSRIRGALDNHRRQTKIETGPQPTGKAQSREEYLASHPLTEEQIMADTEATEDEKLNAIDFLNGEGDSAISRFYYDGIYERAQKSSSFEDRQKKEKNEPAEEKKEEKPQQPQPKWQYQFHYDKETGRAWITRDDVSGSIPIGDGRFRIEGRSLSELRGILENPANNLGELLKEVEAQLHNAEALEKWRRENDPMAAIEDAARLFRGEQKSQDQQDIDDALKEFSDFLDKAKGSSVLDKFMRKGLEGNDKAQASLLDAFTLTNDAQRMFLKDLLRLASKVGYAYIKSGVHDVQAWSKKMSDSIGAKLKEVLGWEDSIVNEFVDEVWNQKYTVDGQRMRLSEHAERLKNGKGTDTAVNEHKNENNEPEKVVSSQQEASEEKPKTKDGWMRKMNEVFKELCKKYGVPDDPIILNQWGGRYGFDYRITKGYRLEQFEPYYESYKKKLDEPVEPASDKQLAFIDRLAEEGEKEMLHSIKLNKVSASYVINILKAAEDAITNRMATADVFEEYANELEKVAKLHGWEPKLQGDSAEFAEREKKIDNLGRAIYARFNGMVEYDEPVKPLSAYKQMAKEEGLDNLSDTDLQEIIETQIVEYARYVVRNAYWSDRQKFDKIVKLYNSQPSLNARDNDRINKQQYSTAAPMAYLMGLFASKGKKVESGLEPSAGNGMLTINLPKEKMHVNDIDEMRLSNLQKQGFGEVTSQDGLQSFGEKKYDVVVTNPPFGNVTPKVYDGIYEISGLEHQMAINALESMKDDGRAAIIIGGNTEYNQNGSIKGKDRTFLNYLYAHYNVVDVINMNGHELYSRQGTGFPLRMILINGRKEFNPRSFAPVIQKARAERVNSYDELFKRVNDDILSDKNKPASVHDTKSGESRRVDDTSNAGVSTQTGVRNVQPTGSQSQPAGRDANGSSVSGSNNTTGRTDTAKEPVVDTRPTGVGSRTETSQPSRTTADRTEEQRNESRGNDTERPSATADNSQRVGQRGTEPSQQPEQPEVKRSLGTEKVPYRKQSGNPFTLQSLMPAEQADVVKKALEELGDVDQFLVNELGYSSKEELHQALAAEQIDSVALAIHQMNQGNAFIIGDQTGIGKGRQAAALIRYGVKKGGFPVFITVKKALFSDMYRDLFDIGSPKLRPFIWSADDAEHSGNVTDKNGNVIYQTPSAKEQKRVIDYINKNGKLPPEYDYVLTTYDSFKSGTMDYENGNKSARRFSKGKSAGPVHINGQAKRDALEALAGNSYVIMDESHNAGGEGSNVSNYLQYITTKAKGLTFLSATFAKRPGNMPIYSLKTAISKAGVKVTELIDAVKRGGATFQEIMSKALTEAGQMIRRERDMTGVTIDWRGIEDEAIIQKQRDQYDTVIGLFNDIIDFQRRYVDPIVNKMNDDAAESQGEVDHTPGTRDMGINNTPFASRTYNMVQQVLLSLKAEEAAKRAIEHLKLGRKPVITVANTNEGAADEAAGMGEAMEMPDLSVNLKKGLQGTLRITKKDAFGNTVNEMIPFDRLSEAGRKRYQEIIDAIENASSGLSLSPIDVIKNELKKAGYKVGELTGRKAEFVYNEDGTVNRVKRQDTDKKRIAADFNNGKLDALILNRSAGTGISLHASSTFEDKRQRIMIVAQAQGDVNDEVQIRGRIDRTGQVLRGMYEYVVSQIPSEQRLLMMLKAKLRSLDANTTSSQKSKFNDMQVQDIINKYGDDIVIQYLAEHPDLAMKMCDPLKWGEGADTLSPEMLISKAEKVQGDGGTASKVLGRMALLTVKEQEKMLKEIGDLYQAEIDRLNEMGENDLEITEMPLRAKTLKKDVWEEGVEPGGKNPFADNSYVEEVEMDVLKKPMKAEEVKKSQERLLGGKTWDKYKQEQLDKVENWAEQKKEETRKTFTERAEKKATAEKEKYAKGAKKAQEKNGMTDAEIEKNAGYQYDTFYKQEMEKLDNALAAIDKQKQVFVDALDTFTTDGVYALPTDIYDLSQLTFEPSFGKVIDINIKEDNYSTTASTITFATLDGRRKITIPISGMVKQNNGEKRDIKPVIVQQTAQTRHGMFGSNVANTLKVLEQNIDNWDKLTSTATRKKGYIITGNLLKALTSLRSQNKGGKLISYTTDTGDVRQGILMSDQFEPGSLTSKNPISSAKKDLDDWEKDYKIVSADGDVTVKRGRYDWRNNTYDYTLQVPKSKKKGDKYFNDKTLLGLMDGQFEGSSKMSADFPASNLDAVLKRLDELGVTIESAKEDKINTSDPMKAINQAAESWRSSAKESESSLSSSSDVDNSEKKSVPLERRTLKSYTDKDENYHKGIEEELRDLESEISGRGADENQTSGQEVDRLQGAAIGRRPVNELRKEAAKLRAEISRRNQKKQDLRQKYNIDEKGNISLSDLRRMFHDFNTNKVVGKLFDKVADILEKLGVDFRFTDNFDALTSGESFAFFNSTFFNWDAYTRNRTDQEKAKTILHEMIHNVAQHILERYEHPERYPKLGELTKEQKRIAQRLLDIFDVVKKANLVRKNGNVPRGTLNAHEMLSEIADEEFRDMLDHIQYREKRTALQAIKEWFKDLLSSFGINFENRSVLGNLEEVLDDILDTYDDAGMKEYRKQRELVERDLKDAGYTGDITDYVENEMLNDGGRASKVEDAALLSQLENGPKEIGYRNVVLNDDGSMGSPMADKLGKKGEKKSTTPFETGNWEQSDEHPELADENGKIDLIKPDGLGTVGKVDYNPYIHIRPDKVNKQFKNAWERPNLVYVEVEYPQSELTSGYKAEKAKKSVGRHKWNGGELILSRWDKVTRIVPWEEVADDWVDAFKNRGVEFDIVPPKLLPILADRGIEILPPHKNMSDECNAAYQRFVAQQEADPMHAIRKAAAKWNISKKEREEHSPLSYSAKQVYNERLNRVETVFSEAYQDAMVSLKTAQNAIAGDKEIPDSQNAYMAENLMHGKNKNEQDLFNMQHRDPIIRIINKIMNTTGMNWGDVDRYVYTKSGLERNREFFVRDWLEAERNRRISKYEDLNPEEQDIYDSMAATIEDMFEDGDIDEEEKNKKLAQALQKAHQSYVDDMETKWVSLKDRTYLDLQAGDITFPDYLNAMDNFILDNIDGEYNPSEHDYSGFREMFGDEDGKYDEEEIISELMDTEDEINSNDEDGYISTVDELWEQINEATRYGLERYREAGMRSDEDIDRVEQMFHFYVPMRGFKAETGEDMYQYFTGKDKAKSYVGGLLKHAKGRGSEAEYPISTIFAMSYKAIADCNQNLVNQKFYRLCQANPNDLVVLSDSWAVYNETTGEWEESVPEIGDDMSEDEVREATLAWEEQMRHLALEHKAKKIKGKAEFDYKPMDKKNQSEHIVDVRINGQPKKMIVTSNPRMAQALNGQLRFEHGRNVFSRWNAAIKNMMATFFTSYSPTFALRNMARDWTHFRTMLGVREGHGYASQANKYYRQSLFKMVGLFKKYREGTLDESKEMERDFKDFMDNGGITGFVFMQKIDDIQKEMENIYKKQKAGKPIRLNDNLWEKVLGAVEAMNEGIENNARFATYRASRHYAGRTKARSAYDAKEITVNFNRKGAGSKTAGFKSQSKKVEDAAKAFGVTSQIYGEGKIFFNATVQAIATTFKNFQNPDGSLNKPYIAKWAAKYALPPFMFGLALPMINKALAAALGGDGDDDPYANLPEWTRRRNLCFYIGNNNFITIPIGQELAAFLTLGDILAGYMFANDLKPVDRDFKDEMIDVFNTFSPVDVSTKITKGGLMEDPVDEVAGRTFSVLAPLVAVQQNLGWTGRPIYREDVYASDKYNPEYQMVYQNTNPLMVEASKLANDLSGGDDVERGKIQVNPAIVQYLWEQYTGGPGKVFSNTISIGKDAKDILTGKDNDFNIRKVEGVKAFVQQGDDRTEYYRTQAKYRKYLEDARKMKDAENGYKQAAATDPLAITKLEKMSASKEYVRMEIALEAEKTLSKIYKAANQAEGKERKELRKLYNEQMKEVVDMLDEVGNE